MAFKMRGFSGFKQRTEGPVKPKSMMEAKEKKSTETSGDVKLSPSFEDPIKIQKLQREGLTPDSKEFSNKAFLQSQNESKVKRSDLDAKGKKLWDAKRKKKNVDPFSLDEQAYENAQNDFDTDNPTKAQMAASKAKIKKERE